MKRRTLAALLILASCLAARVALAWSSTTSCASVTTSPSTIANADLGRIELAIVTTSATTVYVRLDGGTAAIGGASSLPLKGPALFTQSRPVTSTAISAIAASGTVWVCSTSTD